MFESLDRAAQGDLGEVRAIYELVKLGYVISKPMHVHIPYDLIADKDGQLFRVQVKTSGRVVHQTTMTYEVYLETSGGNTKSNVRKAFDATKIDLLFVMTADDRCWLIPSHEITSHTTIKVGTPRYAQYQIGGSIAASCLDNEAIIKCNDVVRVDKRQTTPPFTKDDLSRLLWEKPTTEIAQEFGMSDNGIARWATKWNLSKPPRGYWQRNKNLG